MITKQMCALENFKISNLKISEAFVIDFEVTFLCDFVSRIFLRLSLEFGSQGP